jgi:probable HAF family extracellular repeat protein
MTPDGSKMVGWAYNAQGRVAVTWVEDQGFTELGDLPDGSYDSAAYAISADGSVVAGSSSGVHGSEAFRWTADDGMMGLGDLPGGEFLSYVQAVSADGSIIVGASWTEKGPTAFIWDEARVMRALEDVLIHDYGFYELLPQFPPVPRPNFSLVRDLSRDGQIILGNAWIADLHNDFVPGDTNFDDEVDLTDFGTLKANFGTGQYRDQGDFNADARVDLSDFGLLKEQFGKEPAPVPEPSALAMMALALFSLVVTRFTGR